MRDATVVIVDLRLDPHHLALCLALLDPEETARAGRFARVADRARFVASHAALRVVLGRTLGIEPEALRFGADEAGRPFLAGSDGRLDFNLSHSGDCALIGLADGARIGVDVEWRRPLPDALRIARAHFAPEETQALAALPPPAREAAFFGLWTRKEAVVKATGHGLSLALDAFSVTVPPEPARFLRGEPAPRAWTLADIAAPLGYAATAAVTAAAATIRTERLPAGWLDHFGAK
jgi:4'-phosphopantetheinyl transferase